jgi:hypothetical protein
MWRGGIIFKQMDRGDCITFYNLRLRNEIHYHRFRTQNDQPEAEIKSVKHISFVKGGQNVGVGFIQSSGLQSPTAPYQICAVPKPLALKGVYRMAVPGIAPIAIPQQPAPPTPP